MNLIKALRRHVVKITLSTARKEGLYTLIGRPMAQFERSNKYTLFCVATDRWEEIAIDTIVDWEILK